MPPGTDEAAATLIPPAGSVTVRMYFSGFGDCFLLAFRGDDDRPRYMLIDCGIHNAYPERSARMKAIARDIAKTTGNRLDVVAVTHEHTDHIYGFMYGKDAFRTIDVGQVWLAWTEDPENTLAQNLKNDYGKKKLALQAAIRQLDEAGNPHAARLRSVLGFEFDLAAADSIRSNEDIMNALRNWYDRKPDLVKDYRVPGEAPLEIPGVSGIRCFVLGPPQDETAIKTMKEESEMYFASLPLTEEKAFMTAVLRNTGMAGRADSRELHGYPFDDTFTVPEKEKEKAFGGFFRKYYGFSRDRNEWPHNRRIETDWLRYAADQLALSINEYTNNTSLVLALEMAGSGGGKVLLFAGDAQAGNWLSWQKCSWEEDGRTMTGEDLLRKTVLYKVGHHGSWNATMRQKGLELMESEELVAMLPVDQEWAGNEQGWEHPDERILTRLRQKTKERILRSDKIPEGSTMKKPKEADDGEWKAFVKNVEWDTGPDKLWIQYTVS